MEFWGHSDHVVGFESDSLGRILNIRLPSVRKSLGHLIGVRSLCNAISLGRNITSLDDFLSNIDHIPV